MLIHGRIPVDVHLVAAPGPTGEARLLFVQSREVAELLGRSPEARAYHLTGTLLDLLGAPGLNCAPLAPAPLENVGGPDA